MNRTHKELAAGRWFELTLLEQMANIGSEVSRALQWQKKGDTEYSRRAVERALELFDLTLADPRWEKRLQEITRAREVVCDYFFGENKYRATAAWLDKYFYEFAYAVTKNK